LTRNRKAANFPSVKNSPRKNREHKTGESRFFCARTFRVLARLVSGLFISHARTVDVRNPYGTQPGLTQRSLGHPQRRITMNNSNNTGAGVDPNPPGMPSLPQPALPFPAPDGVTYHGLTLDQLHANLKQAWENLCAWPRQPTGGFHGNMPDGQHSVAWAHDLCDYQVSGLNVARKKLGDTISQRDLIVSFGLDPNGDKNARH
jgi:hypothetical protein